MTDYTTNDQLYDTEITDVNAGGEISGQMILAIDVFGNRNKQLEFKSDTDRYIVYLRNVRLKQSRLELLEGTMVAEREEAYQQKMEIAFLTDNQGRLLRNDFNPIHLAAVAALKK